MIQEVSTQYCLLRSMAESDDGTNGIMKTLLEGQIRVISVIKLLPVDTLMLNQSNERAV